MMVEQEPSESAVMINRNVLERLIERGIRPEDLEAMLGDVWQEIRKLQKIKRGKQPEVILYSGTEMLKAVELAYRMGRQVADVKELAPIMRKLLKLRGKHPRKARRAPKPA